MRRGRVEIVPHSSELLRSNPLGDPAERELVVCLPPGYDEEPERRYPVVVCLTGFTGAGYMMLNRSAWTPNLPERHDALLARGEIEPMILVAPDCFTRFGGSQYRDSAATGAYESYLIREVVPFLRARYRTAPAPSRWGLMGKSSGGYGTLVLGMRHPDCWSALACHSGDTYFDYCYWNDFAKTAGVLERQGGLRGFLEWFEAQPKKSNDAMTAMNVVAMAACYSPREPYPGFADPELGIDLPFDIRTGRVKDAVWQRWLTHDPVRMIETDPEAGRHRAALGSMRLLFLDCGLRDEFHLQYGTRIFVDGLKRFGIRHRHEEFDDGHMNIGYRYDRSLVLLSQALRAEPSS